MHDNSQLINNQGERAIEPGWFTISVGGEQPEAKSSINISDRLQLSGDIVKLDK